MSAVVERAAIRGSSREELDRELIRFRAELRREFAKYHQREYRDHYMAAWLIRWLMSDDSRSMDICPASKSSRRTTAGR